MPGEAGETLRSLRVSRGWDKRRMAAELRKVSDEPLPQHLHKMISGWEKNEHEPSERYLLLYQKAFPRGQGVNGTVPRGPGPDAVLDRARHMPGPGEIIAAAEAAISAGMPRDKILAVEAAALEFEKQLAAFRARLQELLGELDAEDE